MPEREQPKYPSSCVERFLDYVTMDTKSEEGTGRYPSTPGQLELLSKIASELRDLGLEEVEMDKNGYVFATVPATTTKSSIPAIGFIAHVDTSPEMSGAGVKPVLHEDYDGGDLVLPDDPAAIIRPGDSPALADQIGNTIITASGTTLLGADNKAGVAEIVGAAEVLMAHPEIPHGVVRLGFTPDEEIGQGTRYFDVKRFAASCAYTMDGESRGQIDDETFSADSMTLTFHGFNTHPGFARGKMVNAIKVAADFIGRLPAEGLSPETTDAYRGFVHPYLVEAGVDCTAVKFIVRDFKTSALAEYEALLKRLAEETVGDHRGARVECSVEESYRNMKEVLDRYPAVVENAREAIRRAGLDPIMKPIRGGTDGSRLSFMGLPTPNIFAGEHNFHSRYEWVSTYDMHKAVEVIIELSRVWEERSG